MPFGTRLIAISAMGLALAGCGKSELKPAEKPAAAPQQQNENVVKLPAGNQQTTAIETTELTVKPMSIPISATAVIELNADRVAKISPRASGKIIKLIASQGDRVRAGQPLAHFDTPEIGQIWAEQLKAKSRVELSRKNLKREESLFEKNVSPEKDVLKARQELSEAEADLDLAKGKASLLGIEVKPSTGGGRNYPVIALSSPIGGVVVEKSVSQGEAVGPDKVLFTVADLSALWVMVDIYEKDLVNLKVGTGVKVSTAAFPEKSFQGRVSTIGDMLDEKTRTVKARVTVDNSGGFLKPGMFATVIIASGKAENTLAVPAAALQRAGEKLIAFVARDATTFEKRVVTVGPAMNGMHQVLSGLKPGERVVTKGAFILKSETMKGLIGGE
ncbi:MAG: efflux RND transporter periplasmic adaptor subunit [Desulfuromonadaceae bacterium]